MKKTNKPVKMKERKDINIGLIVFFVILLYLLFCLYVSFTKKELSLYEVKRGSVFSDKTYTGIILRTEEVVPADMTGYVSLYFREGDRIPKNEAIYSMDSDKTLYNMLAGDGSELVLENDDIKDLKSVISIEYRNADSFEDYKKLKETLSSSYNRQLDKRLLANLNDYAKQLGRESDFHVVKSEKAGIISFCIDDFTSLTMEEITSAMFDEIKEIKSVNTSDCVKKDDPVYKVITEDEWQIVIKIDENLFKQVKETEEQNKVKEISVSINKSNNYTAPYEMIVDKDDYYMILSFSKYITEYTKYRFVDVNFNTVKTEGLKIPETALLTKMYYRIPKNHFDTDEEGNTCLYIENINEHTGESIWVKTGVSVFYDDGWNNYIDGNLLSENTIIKAQNFNKNKLNIYSVLLDGVYNINNGYTVFKRVEKISHGEGYFVIKDNSASGISEYDHILLEADKASEGDIIY